MKRLTKKLTVPVLELKPTQFAVGMLEVDEKIKQVAEFSKKERKAYIAENVVPVVRGPDKLLYIIDKHHYLCVCYHLGIKEVEVEITTDLAARKMSYRQFWKWMRATRNAYPFCQFGQGPRNEYYLPKDVRGLADDPYRSLAWFVRKAGAFENSDKNFAEFKWANFFRSKKLLDREGLPGFHRALLKATALAQSPAAKRLPGFGKLGLTEQKKVRSRVKRRMKIAQQEAQL